MRRSSVPASGHSDACFAESAAVEGNNNPGRSVQRRMVERNFRMLNIGSLEVRPIVLRRVKHTPAHVLIIILALKITRCVEQKLHDALGATDNANRCLRCPVGRPTKRYKAKRRSSASPRMRALINSPRSSIDRGKWPPPGAFA